MNLYNDLYGCKLDNLGLVKTQIEQVLGIKLVERDSDYLGTYYKFKFNDEEEVVCQKNQDPYEEDEWMESGFKMYPTIIYVNDTARPYEFEKLLKSSEVKLELLRREKL
jgi:hypothetical protein